MYSTTSNALNLSTLDAGMYILKSSVPNTKSFWCKAREGGISRNADNMGMGGYLNLMVIPKKIPATFDNVTRYAYLYVYNSMQSGSYTFTDSTSGFTRGTWNIEGKVTVTLDTEQTVTGTKTFSTLPQSSVVPTNDNQLVNKKYVDDAIAQAIANLNN